MFEVFLFAKRGLSVFISKSYDIRTILGQKHENFLPMLEILDLHYRGSAYVEKNK